MPRSLLFPLACLALLAGVIPASAEPQRCGTTAPFIDGVFQGGTRARPASDGFEDSLHFDIRVHWIEGEEDLVPDIMQAVEDAWRLQVDDWGWYPPLTDDGEGGSDSLDFYIAECEGAAGYTSPEDWWVEEDRTVCNAHVVIDPDLGANLTESTTAHEFNHVLQMAMDCREDHQFFEATATYAEEFALPDYDYNWMMAAYYQDGYYRSLDYFEYSQPPQYGSFIFLQYLAELYGEGTGLSTREIWSDAVQTDNNNSNTWMDALERWLADHWVDDVGTPEGEESYTELAWREFAEWRYFLGEHADSQHFQHGRYYISGVGSELPNIAQIDQADFAVGAQEVDLHKPLAETSSGVILLRYPEAGAFIEAELVANDSEDRWAITLVFTGPSGELIERTRGPIGGDGSAVSGTVPSNALNGQLLVANVGDGLLDPNEDDWTGTGGIVTVVQTVEQEGDDDDSAGDDDGCECSSTGERRGGWISILWLALVLGLRRRQS